MVFFVFFFLQKSNNIFWASVVTLEIWLVVVAAVTPNVKSIQTFLGWIPCCEIIHYAHPSSFCCAISHGWPLCIGLCMFLLLPTIFTPGLVRVHTIKYSLYTRGSIWNSVIAKEKEFFCFAQRDLKVVYWPPCKIGTATFWSPCKINRVFPAECRHRISLAATNIWRRPAYIYCCKSFIDCSRAF